MQGPLALLLTSLETLYKFPKLSCLSFPTCESGDITITSSGVVGRTELIYTEHLQQPWYVRRTSVVVA